MKKLINTLIILTLTLASHSCIEDGVSSSPSDQPTFSTDTLRMGAVFTEQGSPTYSFMVYNKHSKIMQFSHIGFAEGSQGHFRLNVDGRAGKEFSGIEIRPSDSIYVFVDAILPSNGEKLPVKVEDAIEFTCNGVTTRVVIEAMGRDVTRLRGYTITSDTTFSEGRPVLVFDSLVVAPGAKLTLGEGVELLFHDKAEMRVRGTLESRGSAQKPVTLGGERTGYVAADIPYEVMSRQWEGVTFYTGSRNNTLSYTVIENAWHGVTLDSLDRPGGSGEPALQMVNCRLRNSAGNVLRAHHSSVSATGCEFAEAGGSPVALHGGTHIFSYCTISNNYLFSYPSGPLVSLSHLSPDLSGDGSAMPYLRADISNSILVGSGGVLSHGELEGTAVYLRRCMLGTTGDDDAHFINTVWDGKPQWANDFDHYIFDYRLLPESEALGQAQPSMTPTGAIALPETDFYGGRHTYPAAIGAYEAKQ